MSRGSFPLEALTEALRAPGIDPRIWVSNGVVEASQVVDGEVVESVEFDADGMGPLVNVRLQPYNLSVRCRVLSNIAGNGEGSFNPFVEGDEVAVLLPGGDPRSGCLIVGRLNNTVDKFPTSSIAGQDPTKNTFGFERRRSMFIQEYASTYMLRIASHGAFILIAESGAITLRDGSKGALQMGPDLFGYVEGTREVGTETPAQPKALLQLDLTGRRATMQVDDALLMLNSSSADAQPGNCFLIAPAEVTVQCGTNAPQESVLTVEAFLAILDAFANALAAPAAGPVAMTAIAAAAIATGGAPLSPALAGALATGKAIAALAAKPDTTTGAVPGIQMLPGLGAVMFKTG